MEGREVDKTSVTIFFLRLLSSFFLSSISFSLSLFLSLTSLSRPEFIARKRRDQTKRWKASRNEKKQSRSGRSKSKERSSEVKERRGGRFFFCSTRHFFNPSLLASLCHLRFPTPPFFPSLCFTARSLEQLFPFEAPIHRKRQAELERERGKKEIRPPRRPFASLHLFHLHAPPLVRRPSLRVRVRSWSNSCREPFPGSRAEFRPSRRGQLWR